MASGQSLSCLVTVSDKLHYIGFDLSAMGEEVYLDSVVDVVGPETLVSEPYAIKVRVAFVR